MEVEVSRRWHLKPEPRPRPGRHGKSPGPCPPFARFPTEQRPVYLPMPCPECGLRTLRRYAPRRYEAPVTIACESHACEHIISEDGFDWVARTLETTTGRAS